MKCFQFRRCQVTLANERTGAINARRSEWNYVYCPADAPRVGHVASGAIHARRSERNYVYCPADAPIEHDCAVPTTNEYKRVSDTVVGRQQLRARAGSLTPGDS